MADNTTHFDRSMEKHAPEGPYVRIVVVDVDGSAPADAGADMIVTAAGLHRGSVGGGRIEARAIAEAKAMLEDASTPPTRFVEWNLKHDIGMTCGGVMKLYFERCNLPKWQVVIFGAGHVGQALARLCSTLPCRTTVVDPRREWLDRLPEADTLDRVHLDQPEAFVEQLPGSAFIVCMTRGHVTDVPVLEAILRGAQLPPFVGVIGSRSKAAVLKRELAERGVEPQRLEHLVCPVGLPIGGNHPGEIAISIAAQLLERRDRWMAGQGERM